MLVNLTPCHFKDLRDREGRDPSPEDGSTRQSCCSGARDAHDHGCGGYARPGEPAPIIRPSSAVWSEVRNLPFRGLSRQHVARFRHGRWRERRGACLPRRRSTLRESWLFAAGRSGNAGACQCHGSATPCSWRHGCSHRIGQGGQVQVSPGALLLHAAHLARASRPRPPTPLSRHGQEQMAATARRGG